MSIEFFFSFIHQRIDFPLSANQGTLTTARLSSDKISAWYWQARSTRQFQWITMIFFNYKYIRHYQFGHVQNSIELTDKVKRKNEWRCIFGFCCLLTEHTMDLPFVGGKMMGIKECLGNIEDSSFFYQTADKETLDISWFKWSLGESAVLSPDFFSVSWNTLFDIAL